MWMAAPVLLAMPACGDDDGGNDAGGEIEEAVETVDDGSADADQADVEPETPEEAAADADGDGDADAEAGDDAPVVSCDELGEGTNEGFLVDTEPRAFFLDLPADVETGGPWPVVFNYHGLGDTAENMRNLLSSDVDNTVLPFILVTPEDTNFALGGLMNIDWDVATVTADNREARMFDAVLECLESRWGVDDAHVHAVGFSMGGFLVDALGTVRGERLASVVTYSGGYGSNPANLSGFLASLVSWPEYTTANDYVQVFLHGGTTDTYNLTVQTLHFDQMAANDAVWLNGFGHDVVVCDHGGGHTVPFSFRGEQVVRFFADHPLGTVDSPYASGLPVEFPGDCTFQGGAK